MKKIFFIFIIFIAINALYAEDSNKFFFQIEKGTQLYAIDDGVLMSFGFDKYYGNYMEIDYSQINLIVKYCNLGKMKYFYDKKIRKGDKIAESGESGFIEEPGVTLIITIKEDFLLQNKIEKDML